MNTRVEAWFDRIPAGESGFVMAYLLTEIARTGTATTATVEEALQAAAATTLQLPASRP